ncbi:ATPase [Halobacteriales archaeon Cl-PHB]
MSLLVAGSQRVDAGKTTFATGLVAYTGSVGFKPRAGNDYWFDHDDVRTAVEASRLYGKDAKRLAAVSPGDRPPEAINPVHRLWRPSPGPDTGILGQDDREFLLDRAGDRLVVNGTVQMPDRIRAALPVDDAVTVESLAELNEVMGEIHLPALQGVATKIAAADRPVVESYSDIARPLQDLEPDAVAVVEAGRARTYDGDRWAKACEVAPGGPRDGQLEERVDAVTDLVDPVDTLPLAPLSGDQRADPAAVAEAYRDAYDSLLDLAR